MSESENYTPQEENTENTDASSTTQEVLEYVDSELARMRLMSGIGIVANLYIDPIFYLLGGRSLVPLSTKVEVLQRAEYRSQLDDLAAQRERILKTDRALFDLADSENGGEELDEEALSEEFEIMRALVNKGDSYILNNQFQTQRLAESTHSTLTELEKLIKEL
ncbi:MAG: hypothetical protein ACFCU8_11645 [Thermosynechococcaceae cyanobacterium]